MSDFADLIPDDTAPSTGSPAHAQSGVAAPAAGSFSDLIPDDHPSRSSGAAAPPPPPQKDNGPPVALADEPGKEYGTVLPFSRDTTTGKTELAFPEFIRGPVHVASRATQEMFGDRPIDTKTALEGATMGLTAPAGAVASGAAREGPAAMRAVKDAPAEALAAFRGSPRTPNLTSDGMRQVARGFYKEAADKGGVLTPDFTNKFVDAAAAMTPQTEAGKLVAGEDAVSGLVGRLNNIRDRPMSLDEAQEIDEHIGDLIDKEYTQGKLSKQGKRIADIQGQFRDMINNAGADEVASGENGFNALAQGRAAWSQTMKMRDLERILTRAEHSEQPVTTVRAGIRTMLANPSRLRGYSPDEIEALKKAGQTGIVTDVLRLAGSRLVPIITGAAGVGAHGADAGLLGAGASYVASTAARNLAAKRQMQRLHNVINKVGGADEP